MRANSRPQAYQMKANDLITINVPMPYFVSPAHSVHDGGFVLRATRTHCAAATHSAANGVLTRWWYVPTHAERGVNDTAHATPG